MEDLRFDSSLSQFERYMLRTPPRFIASTVISQLKNKQFEQLEAGKKFWVVWVKLIVDERVDRLELFEVKLSKPMADEQEKPDELFVAGQVFKKAVR